MEYTYHMKTPGQPPRKVHPDNLDLYFWTIHALTGWTQADAENWLQNGGVIHHPKARFYAGQTKPRLGRPPQ